MYHHYHALEAILTTLEDTYQITLRSDLHLTEADLRALFELILEGQEEIDHLRGYVAHLEAELGESDDEADGAS